jgi:hypothetical protein
VNDDKALVCAATVVNLLCDAAAAWCAFTGRRVYGAVLLVLASAIAICTWRYYLNHVRP